MEESELSKYHENLVALENNYKEVAMDSVGE
jgi:hypothetical protein